MPLLEVENLNLRIGGSQILCGVSFSLAAGEILGLVGESGAGKSMVGLSILQLLPPNIRFSGAIRLDGLNIASQSERALCRIRGQEIGFIFQEPMSSLNPLIPIGNQVAESFRLHRKVSHSRARVAARQALDRVGLPAPEFRLGRYPYQLSGGQRQRVAIAIATVLQPKLLIADEPTTALDVTTQAQILGLLKSLARETGTGIIFISHDLAVISQLADNVAVMKKGAVVEQGAVRSVLREPQHPYTKMLLASTTARTAVPARESSEVLLEAKGLRREYSESFFLHKQSYKRAVDNVTFRIKKGERVGIVGESGSGKSSLLRMILALDTPQEGEVYLSGKSFTRAKRNALRAMRRRIQAVFQDPYGSFDPRLRVEDIVAEPFHLLEKSPRGRLRRIKVQAMLERVGLAASDADRYPHEFSGGERQRIAIARSLIIEPEIVALDEAVSALDAATKAQILALLSDLWERLGISYLFVSHDLVATRAITDRVLVMQNGRIVEEGPTEQIFTAPRHAYTRALIAAASASQHP